jgi:hemoglobin/transferrin/lactoferrin receptor protein
VLPSLTFQYDITPRLMTYLQYQRGAQFPNASQLYGSWNLGSSYAGRAQYALIGNTDLKTETSDNLSGDERRSGGRHHHAHRAVLQQL